MIKSSSNIKLPFPAVFWSGALFPEHARRARLWTWYRTSAESAPNLRKHLKCKKKIDIGFVL